MGFFLFILVNASLFLRPGEIVPDLMGVSIYEYLIIACLIFSLPEILQYLMSGSLDTQPITLCVLGVLIAIVVSQLAALNFGEAWNTGYFFLKVVVYYVLLVSLLNTPQRLRRFLGWVVCFAVVLTVVTVLQFYEVIQLPTLQACPDNEIDPATGVEMVIKRLQGSGIFADPNEFCIMLAATVPLCLFFFTNPKAGFFRFLWLGPLGLFLYAIALTHSRGGFLGFVAGLGVLAFVRLGGRRALLAAALGFPILLVLFAGRQTSLSATSGTGQSRVQIWSDWLMEFRQAPLFGKGLELPGETNKNRLPGEDNKAVAHNSFLHGFAELGFFGGMLFLGASYLALLGVWRLAKGPGAIRDPEQRRLNPFLMGTVAAYVVGMLSLSLCYLISTYLVLGLAAVYMRVTEVYPPLPPLRFDTAILRRLALLSVAFLACVYVFVRIFLRWA